MLLISQSVYRFNCVVSTDKQIQYYNITIYPLFIAVIIVQIKTFPMECDPRRR